MKTLRIKMSYTYVGDTSIEVPDNMTFEEAYEYAQDHIDDIPIAVNAEYISYSDNFELEDCDFVKNGN